MDDVKGFGLTVAACLVAIFVASMWAKHKDEDLL